MKIYNTAIKILIYLTVFLIPLFFLPWTTEAFNFPKVHLLFFLISLILILWIARMLRYEKRVKFYQTPLDLPVLILLCLQGKHNGGLTSANFAEVRPPYFFISFLNWARFWRRSLISTGFTSLHS